MVNDKFDKLYDQLLILTKSMASKLEEEAKKTGFNKSEYILIRDVIDHPQTTQQALCDRTGLKKSSVSKSLNRLIETGVISRAVCDKDRREAELSVKDPNTLNLFCKTELLSNMFSGDTACVEDLSKHLEILINLIGEA